ncbi:hypothetical protein DFH09DRAFT_1277835 [Mycena vulgaris]|nr:hypothetical protein DFH09DRAFT_1277835 [Mycena vulgaris]
MNAYFGPWLATILAMFKRRHGREQQAKQIIFKTVQVNKQRLTDSSFNWATTNSLERSQARPSGTPADRGGSVRGCVRKPCHSLPRRICRLDAPERHGLKAHSLHRSNDIPLDGILGCAKMKPISATEPFDTRNANPCRLSSVGGLDYKEHHFIRDSAAIRWEERRRDYVGRDGPSKYDASSLVIVKNVNTSGFWEASLDAVNADALYCTQAGRVFVGGIEGMYMLTIMGRRCDPQIHARCKVRQLFKHVDDPVQYGRPGDLAFLPVDPQNTTGACKSDIAVGGVSEGPTHWLVGDTFLKNMYLSTNGDFCGAIGEPVLERQGFESTQSDSTPTALVKCLEFVQVYGVAASQDHPFPFLSDLEDVYGGDLALVASDARARDSRVNGSLHAADIVAVRGRWWPTVTKREEREGKRRGAKEQRKVGRGQEPEPQESLQLDGALSYLFCYLRLLHQH